MVAFLGILKRKFVYLASEGGYKTYQGKKAIKWGTVFFVTFSLITIYLTYYLLEDISETSMKLLNVASIVGISLAITYLVDKMWPKV